jgi:CubicO group peptidase (beta-lactamase class C family)
MMRRSSRAFAAVLGVIALQSVAAAAASAQPAGGAAPLPGLDAYVEAAMRDWQVPGLALAIVRNDSVIYARGYGTTEVGGGTPVDEHTLFAIASTTKALTAAALGMLVDEGRVATLNVDGLGEFRRTGD